MSCRKLLIRMTLIVVLPLLSLAQPRLIRGIYRNYALGFSTRIPPGLTAHVQDQAGPERGFDISLPSRGTLTVYGEPNSLGWRSPAEGVRYDFAHEINSCHPSSSSFVISAFRLGDSYPADDSARETEGTRTTDKGRSLTGFQGIFTCVDRFVRVILVFRPGGGPMYWLRLVTTTDHQTEDSNYLDSLAHSFALIPWRQSRP